jgi:transcriptional regulator with XRE-family HTH domain
MNVAGSGRELEVRIGQILAKLREQSGVSQGALALELGHHQSYLSRLESGTRRLTVAELLRWASALGIPFPQVALALEQAYSDLAQTRSIWESEREIS